MDRLLELRARRDSLEARNAAIQASITKRETAYLAVLTEQGNDVNVVGMPRGLQMTWEEREDMRLNGEAISQLNTKERAILQRRAGAKWQADANRLRGLCEQATMEAQAVDAVLDKMVAAIQQLLATGTAARTLAGELDQPRENWYAFETDRLHATLVEVACRKLQESGAWTRGMRIADLPYKETPPTVAGEVKQAAEQYLPEQPPKAA